jgi:lipid-binding SYLF domain-containing protein
VKISPIVLEGDRFVKSLLAQLLASAFLPSAFADSQREQERVKHAGEVLKEILNIPDNIPTDLLDKAECLVILPSVEKGAFGIGGSFGRGVMICRGGEHYSASWGAPAMYALEGVNVGFQLGGEATDFVLLVMNPKGARSLLSSKVKLGADASAAAGPKGRSGEAATDVVMNAFLFACERTVRRYLAGGFDSAVGWQC